MAIISKRKLQQLEKHMKTCGHYCAWEDKTIVPMIEDYKRLLAVAEAAGEFSGGFGSIGGLDRLKNLRKALAALRSQEAGK